MVRDGHFSIVDVHFVGFWRYERENFDQDIRFGLCSARAVLARSQTNEEWAVMADPFGRGIFSGREVEISWKTEIWKRRSFAGSTSIRPAGNEYGRSRR